MNYRTTIVLLVLVAVGAGFFFFAPSESKKSEELKEVTAPKEALKYVLDPRPEVKDIVKVSIEKAGKPKVAFEQTAAADEKDPASLRQWRMTEPVDTPIENYMLEGLIRSFAELQASRSFKPGDKEPSLADAGLSPPAAVVNLTDKKGKTYKFEVGKKAIASDNMYVRLAGAEQVSVTNRDLNLDMKKDANAYRGMGLTHLAGKKPVAMKLTFDNNTFEMTKGADDNWIINQPRKAYAANDKINQLVNKIIGLQAKAFVEDAPPALEPFGLEKPWLAVELTVEQKKKLPDSQPTTQSSQPAEPKFETVTEKVALNFGGFADISNSARYVQPGGAKWVASVDAKSLEGMTPKLVDLIDPKVTRVKAAQATKLEIVTSGGTATLTSENGAWKGSGDLSEVDAEAVRDVLGAFEDLAATDFIENATDKAALGLDKPRATVSVTTNTSVEPVKLLVGAETQSGRNAYVQIAGQPTVIVVSAAQAKRLAIDPVGLRSREVLSARAEELKEIEIRHADGGRYDLVRKDGGWRLAAPADAPADAGAVRDLTNDLIHLRAKRVVGRDDTKYGLSKPEITVNLVLNKAAPQSQPASDVTTQPIGPAPATDEPHQLFINKVGNEIYCKRDESPFVFQLDETVYRVLTTELLNRDLFAFKPEEVADLKIEAPGGALEFERQGKDQWKYVLDPFVQLDPKKVNEFVGEVAKFRAERYLKYGGADLAALQLGDAPVTVTIKLADGSTATLKISQVKSGELPRKAMYVELGRGFLMRQADVEKLLRGLDVYLKSEADNKPKPPPGAPQPQPVPVPDDEGGE